MYYFIAITMYYISGNVKDTQTFIVVVKDKGKQRTATESVWVWLNTYLIGCSMRLPRM